MLQYCFRSRSFVKHSQKILRLLCFYLVYPAAESCICNVVPKRRYVTVEPSVRMKTSWTWEIQDFCCCAVETCFLLWCYVAQVGSWLPTFWDSLLAFMYSQVKEYLKMGLIGCPETSVTNCQPTPH